MVLVSLQFLFEQPRLIFLQTEPEPFIAEWLFGGVVVAVFLTVIGLLNWHEIRKQSERPGHVWREQKEVKYKVSRGRLISILLLTDLLNAFIATFTLIVIRATAAILKYWPGDFEWSLWLYEIKALLNGGAVVFSILFSLLFFLPPRLFTFKSKKVFWSVRGTCLLVLVLLGCFFAATTETANIFKYLYIAAAPLLLGYIFGDWIVARLKLPNSINSDKNIWEQVPEDFCTIGQISFHSDGRYSLGLISFDQSSEIGNTKFGEATINKKAGEGQDLDIQENGHRLTLKYEDRQWYKKVPIASEPSQNGFGGEHLNTEPEKKPASQVASRENRVIIAAFVFGASYLIYALPCSALGLPLKLFLLMVLYLFGKSIYHVFINTWRGNADFSGHIAIRVALLTLLPGLIVGLFWRLSDTTSLVEWARALGGGFFPGATGDPSIIWWELGGYVLTILAYYIGYKVALNEVMRVQYELSVYSYQSTEWEKKIIGRMLTVLFGTVLALFLALKIAAAIGFPIWAVWIAAIIVAYGAHEGIWKAQYKPPPIDPYGNIVRGRKLSTYETVKSWVDPQRPPGDAGVYFGHVFLPSKVSVNHFAFVGTTGSGKTSLIRLLFKSVLPSVGKGIDHRAILYDAKQDMYEQLRGVGVTAEIINLNPFDKRCWAWDIAKDITNPAASLDIATILFYDDDSGKNSGFFTRTSRKILSGVIKSFIIRRNETGIDWTFSDVCRVMRDPDRIREALNKTEETKLVLKSLKVEETIENVFASISSYMEHYEIIAALWDRAEKRISLNDWAKDKTGSILILQKSNSAAEAVNAINHVIFKRMQQIVLSLPNSDTRRTWVFLDELAEAKKPFDGMTSLALQGRSKGVCLVLGFQDIEGLQEVYGEKAANQIVGMCANKALLRIDSPQTQEWAAKTVGQAEVIETTWGEGTSWSVGPQGSSGGNTYKNFQKEIKDSVLPSQFGAMQPADFGANGITGWFVSPVAGAFNVNVPGDFLRKNLPLPSDNTVNFDERDDSEQYLRDWTETERKKLGFDVAEEKAPSSQTGITPAAAPPKPKLKILGIKEIKREDMH